MIESTVAKHFLPYVTSLQERALEAIDLVVVHCTELPDLATAREFGLRIHYPDTGTGNSGHYYIERNGHIEQWVPRERVAHHTRGFNERSLGIELDNRGRYPDWFDSRNQDMVEAYPLTQINSLVGLVRKLSSELPALRWIAGHESLDTSQVRSSNNPELLVRRKKDPGPLFPWNDFLAEIELERLNTN